MRNDIDHIMIDEQRIKARVEELGKRISQDYAGKDLYAVCILKGASVFFTDLIRSIEIPMEIDFMAISSYGNSRESSGIVQIRKDLDNNIEGKDVLIIEDILDSGQTLSYLKEMLSARNPNSLRICALLDKPSRRSAPVEIEYSGFEIPDEFVVGYGLDFSEKYRNLPYIGVLKSCCYS